MNATTGPVFLAAFEDPDEVLEFAISIGLYVFVVRRGEEHCVEFWQQSADFTATRRTLL